MDAFFRILIETDFTCRWIVSQVNPIEFGFLITFKASWKVQLLGKPVLLL